MPNRVIPSKALTEGFDRLIENEPELLSYYDSRGYAGEMSGEGNWCVLYVDAYPVGLLWLSMETGGCDVETVAGSVTDLLALEQLRIRSLAEAGVPAGTAYATIEARYSSSDEDTGDLDVARELLYVP